MAETRMKVFQTLTAVVLLGALSVGSNFAVAKARSHVFHAGSRAMKSEGNSGGNQNVRGPVNAGTTKQGNNLRATGPQNVGAAQPGNNQPNLNAMRPDNADPWGAPVIADGPGHKTNRPADTTKKITTIVRPRVVRQHQRPTGPGNIERNSIGARYDARPKLGLNPKITARVNSVPTAVPGLSTAKTIPNAGSMPTATVRLGHNLTNPPRHGPIIYGSSVSRSGSNATSIGGPTKNFALNGNTFKPRHP
jgi:hypothetical protein